jgi:predicted RNase H-like HicB family nuclease
MELTVRVHFEDGAYWAEVQELPGCFASGETLDALKDALEEAIAMYLEDDEASARPDLVEALRQGTRGALQVDEMKVLVPPNE